MYFFSNFASCEPLLNHLLLLNLWQYIRNSRLFTIDSGKPEIFRNIELFDVAL